MANIRISPEEMRGEASKFSSTANDVQDSINNMDNYLTELQSQWEGAAAQAYEARWTGDLRPSFMQAKELIDEIAQALNTTADEMEQMDAAIAKGFQG